MARSVRSIGASGQAELHRTFQRLGNVVNNPEVERMFVEEAQVFGGIVETNAPLGPTGNLKSGVVEKPFQHKIKDKPAAFVAIDYRVAPHAHLVEFGTVHSAPHPFWRPALRGFTAAFYRRIGEKIGRYIERQGRI